MSLEGRLRYIYADGATKALVRLGWTHSKKPKACVFFKKVDDVYEIMAFRRVAALPRQAVVETMSRTPGLTVKEFLEEYVRVYDGEPPIMLL